MTRGLYAYLFKALDECLPFRTMVDTVGGLRRMDRAEKATYQRMVSMGRLIRGPVPGLEHRPIEFQTVTLSLWVRPETPDPGDLVLEDMTDRIMRALVWRSPSSPIPYQDCTGEDPGIVIMDIEHLDGDTEPFFDDAMQAWTKALNLRCLVALATCQPALAWCGPCGESRGTDSETVLLDQGTAFIFVDNGEEGFVDEYDLYVAHPNIDAALLEATAKQGSIKLYYVIVPLMQQFSSAYFQGKRGVTTEADYWHASPTIDESTRIEYDSDTWYVRPSQSLGQRIATYILSATSTYFDGAYADESHADIPNEYWEAWKLVDPSDNGGVALTDADRPYWENQWDLMHAAFLSTMKAGFGSQKALVANSAGAVYAGIDGITIEESHILVEGEQWALDRFEEQRLEWEASTFKFGSKALNVSWNYPLTDIRVFRGTSV